MKVMVNLQSHIIFSTHINISIIKLSYYKSSIPVTIPRAEGGNAGNSFSY